MNMQRNSRCWCGSGKKYKQCHEKWDDRYNVMKLEGHVMPERTLIKSPEDIRLIRKAAAINNGVLDEVAKHIRPGMTTEAVNTLVHEFTIKHGGIPAPLNYEGFPKSVCTSVNDEVCHGIPDRSVVLQEGDIVTTSGVGGTYPADVIIGQVQSVQKSENDISNYAVIKPYEDLTSVQDVFVVIDFPGAGDGEEIPVGQDTSGEEDAE